MDEEVGLVIGVPKEKRAGETRVAATPESVRKLVKQGFQVRVERNAGASAHLFDEDYVASGAELVDTRAVLEADIVLKVQKPTPDEILVMKRGSLLISLLEPFAQDDTAAKLAEVGVDAIAMELIPRTSRAQAMDVLSSQAGIAGYRAVLESASRFGRFFPMMMTSAGSSKACRLFVLGAGVAGLQAIATARRLGASVEAYDIRPDAQEQIKSLGAKPIVIDIGEEGAGTGGYARELSEQAKQKQQAALNEKLKSFDILITTANVPGRRSPVLVQEDVVKAMRPGSVIVDMAAGNGGNCPLTEADKVVVKHGVTLVGITNFAGLVPTDASRYFAQNLVNLVALFGRPEGSGGPQLDLSDDILAAAVFVHKGALCRQP